MVEIVNKLKLNDKKTLYTYLLFFSMFISKYNIEIGFSLKPYMIITFVGVVLFFKEFKLKDFNLKSYEIVFLAFYLVYCLTIIFAENKGLSIRYIVLLFINITFLLINKIILSESEVNFQQILINVFMFIVVVSLIDYVVGLIRLNFDYSVQRVITNGVLTDRGIARLIGIVSHDPNIAMFYLTIPYFLLVFNLDNKKNIVIFILASILMILTYSRGGWVGYAIALGMMLIFNINKLLKSKIFWGLLGVSLIFIFGSIILEKGIIYKLYVRFLQSISSGGSGRVGLWKLGLEQIVKHPIVGVGINNSRLLITEVSDKAPKLLHNTSLEIIVEMGVVLGLLYFANVGMTLKHLWKGKENEGNRILFLAFIAMFIQAFFLSLPINEFWFFFILCIGLFENENEMSEE